MRQELVPIKTPFGSGYQLCHELTIDHPPVIIISKKFKKTFIFLPKLVSIRWRQHSKTASSNVSIKHSFWVTVLTWYVWIEDQTTVLTWYVWKED